MDYSKLAPQETIEKIITALTQNGMTAELVENGHEAKQKVLSLIPKGSEVMTMTSITLEQTGLASELNDSGNYKSVKKELGKMDRKTQSLEMQKLGAAPEYAIGSVHAITEAGSVYIASNSGSQLPGYAYGSPHILWIVSTKKIVKDHEQAMKRIEEYIVPKESVRARKAYNLPDTFNTFVSKLLVINKEKTPNRIHVIFVNESLGF